MLPCGSTSHTRVSPRRRRWFDLLSRAGGAVEGLSAQAEVVHHRRLLRQQQERSLRAGGGGSMPMTVAAPAIAVSPRRRRWFSGGSRVNPGVAGLSAQAEVVRCGSGACPATGGSLRAGGGGSPTFWSKVLLGSVSPRRRRWFGRRGRVPGRDRGLSAQAEVVRASPSSTRRSTRSLRAGGGGSILDPMTLVPVEVSPRRRRWFVCRATRRLRSAGLSAQAEVVR